MVTEEGLRAAVLLQANLHCGVGLGRTAAETWDGKLSPDLRKLKIQAES